MLLSALAEASEANKLSAAGPFGVAHQVLDTFVRSCAGESCLLSSGCIGIAVM